jgi:hypothetical protein
MSESLAAMLRHRPNPEHRLDASKIVVTAKNLAADIEARLSGSTLAGLAQELVGIAVSTGERGRSSRRPIYPIRVVSAMAIVSMIAPLWYLARHIHARWEFGTITEVFEGFHAGFELLALLLGAIWFCISLEARIKRKKALGFIEELREFIHVIDITQLYFSPDLFRSRLGVASGSLPIDETYLLYCTQMLAVISNLSSLYTRGVTGDPILRAASDVEMLAIAISTKHLSKAEAVHRIISGEPRNKPQQIA